MGLVAELRKDAAEQSMQIAGTPAYMSPEQAAGEGNKVDGRSDLYSIGVCLYKLVTGHCPFEEKMIHKLF